MKPDHQRQVLEWLLLRRSISQYTAVRMFNCWRLSSVILRLRKRKFPIVTDMSKGSNGSYYAVYSL